MAINYTKAAAKAKALIEANGRDVYLYRKNETPADVNQPWRGPAATVNVLVGSGAIKGVFYPIDEKDEEGSVFRRGMMKLMIAHDSLATPQDLGDVDHIVDDGVTFKVEEAAKIGPGDTLIAYEFVLKR